MPVILNSLLNRVDMSKILLIAKGAGERIMKIYADKEFFVEYKEGSSPLTLADKAAHLFIKEGLKKLYPDIPILSEEEEIGYETRKNWQYFWLVDPLDGTKEFIKRNGEFTVNVALVYDGEPVLGVIHAPAKDTIYFAMRGLGAYKLEDVSKLGSITDEGALLKISKRLPLRDAGRHFTVVASKSHLSKETEEYIDSLHKDHKEIDIISSGSSLKLCMIAEGAADVYPRFAPTMEWDIAAGQIIVTEARGSITVVAGGGPLRYGKEDLHNPFFVASSDIGVFTYSVRRERC